MFSAFQTFGKLGAIGKAIASAWSPLSLWPNGIDTPGMWISPRTLDSEWQDYTGTTPVAVPGTVADNLNPAGLSLDIRAGATVLTDPGNHMLQSTSAARPLMSARVNLLTYTEDFTYNAVTAGLTLSSGATTGPFGETDGWKFIEAASIYGHYTRANTLYSFPAGQVLKRTGYFKQGSAGRNVQFGLTLGGDSFGGVIDFSTGTLVAGSTGAGTTVAASVTLVNGWYECTVTGTMGASLTGAHPYEAMTNLTTYIDTSGPIYTGDGSSFVYAFGRDLRAASVASSIPPYQSVPGNGSTYATDFPIAQKYDGVDDGMATAAFTAGTLINGMDCMIAVRRNNNFLQQIVGLYQADQTKYFGVVSETSPNVAPSFGGCGTPTIFVNGVETANTRGDLFDTMPYGEWCILEYRGLDLSAWVNANFGNYGSGYVFPGARGDILLYPSTASTEDKDAARQYLADYYGVTLP